MDLIQLFMVKKLIAIGAQRLDSKFLINSIVYQDTTPWDLINYFVNDPIEECYTCLRIDPLGRVMPTLVLRQTVFNTPNYIQNLKQQFPTMHATSFFDVPRWKIDQGRIINEELVKTDALHINYLFIYGQDPTGVNPASNTQNIMSQLQPYYDNVDIQRYGLKRFPKGQIPVKQVLTDGSILNPEGGYWSGLLADQIFGGQQKISGTLILKGIQAPICEGDNLEYEGNLYHIERVMHMGIIETGEGKKKFITTLNVSSGLSLNQPPAGVAPYISYPVLKQFAPSFELQAFSQVDSAALGSPNDENNRGNY
jgi:hypothetical protein